MKVKNVKRFVKCDVCGVQQDDTSDRGSSHSGHTMIVVSVWDEEKGKRKYHDVCSMKCLAVFANAALRGGEAVPSNRVVGDSV